jgi:hypothetical protein
MLSAETGRGGEGSSKKFCSEHTYLGSQVTRINVFAFTLPLFLRFAFTPYNLIAWNLGRDVDNSLEQGRKTNER